MNAVMAPGEPHDTGMQFRDLAGGGGRLLTSNAGPVTFGPRPERTGETSWDTPVCGDGIVDIGEQGTGHLRRRRVLYQRLPAGSGVRMCCTRTPAARTAR